MAIAHIASTSAEGTSGSATTQACSCASTSLGELLVVTVTRFTGAAGTPSVADNLATAGWTRVGTSQGSAAAGWLDVFYLPNAPAGITTVTATDTNGAFITVSISRFSGAATASPVDGAAVLGSGSTTAVSVGPYTPSVAGDLVFFAMTEGDTTTLTNTWSGSTLGVNVDPTGASGQPLFTAFQVVAGTTAQTPTATMGAAIAWFGKVVGFLGSGATAGSSGGVQPTRLRPGLRGPQARRGPVLNALRNAAFVVGATATSVLSGSGSVAAAGFAPAVGVSANQAVTPGLGAPIATGFAPAASASNNQAVTPGVGSGTLTSVAPSVTVSSAQVPAPGVGVLTGSGFAPAIALPVAVPTGIGSVTATGAAPTAAATANIAVTPALGAPILTGAAPSVVATANQVASPNVGALAAAGFAPTASASSGQAPAPGAGVLALAGAAPTATATLNVALSPAPGVLAVDGIAPTASASDRQEATPGAGVLTSVGAAPAVQLGIMAPSGTGALAAAGFSPAVVTTALVVLTPDVGSLAVDGFAPVITGVVVLPPVQPPGSVYVPPLRKLARTTRAHVAVESGSGSLGLAGAAPTVEASDHRRVALSTAALAIEGAAPAVTIATSPSTRVDQRRPVEVVPAPARATRTVVVRMPTLVRPRTGAVEMLGYAPTVIAPMGLSEAADASPFGDDEAAIIAAYHYLMEMD